MTTAEKYNILSAKYLAASLFATYFSGVVHPLELVKTRFQSHDGKTSGENVVPKYRGITDALKKIYQKEGFRGLYKGFYISLLCQGSSTGFFFWKYFCCYLVTKDAKTPTNNRDFKPWTQLLGHPLRQACSPPW